MTGLASKRQLDPLDTVLIGTRLDAVPPQRGRLDGGKGVRSGWKRYLDRHTGTGNEYD
jgi:hypothetical protein